MTFQKYLEDINVKQYIKKEIKITELNNYVRKCYGELRGDFEDIDIKKLYKYKVPQISKDGTCIINDKNLTTFNLAERLGLKFDVSKLKKHPVTQSLWRLFSILSDLHTDTLPDWIGVYKKHTHNKTGQEVLLKLSYFGNPSRAEFPLTEEFAKISNNSFVGINGQAVLINNLENFEGPYYECDNNVQSEFCCPILNREGEIIGIIDTESFQKDFFNQEKILQISKVCFDLGITGFGV
jgi:putative methionine-R-sulfoxide reductase with GAF domain